jgi:glucose uptake protein
MNFLLIKNLFLPLILAAVALEALADVFFKKWSLGNQTWYLVAALIIYFAGTVAWAVSLKYEYLSKAISVFTVLNLIVVVLAGVFFFKEDLSLINKMGILLGIASVIMLQI